MASATAPSEPGGAHRGAADTTRVDSTAASVGTPSHTPPPALPQPGGPRDIGPSLKPLQVVLPLPGRTSPVFRRARSPGRG